jgi:hypothetical protein
MQNGKTLFKFYSLPCAKKMPTNPKLTKMVLFYFFETFFNFLYHRFHHDFNPTNRYSLNFIFFEGDEEGGAITTRPSFFYDGYEAGFPGILAALS